MNALKEKKGLCAHQFGITACVAMRFSKTGQRVARIIAPPCGRLVEQAEYNYGL